MSGDGKTYFTVIMPNGKPYYTKASINASANKIAAEHGGISANLGKRLSTPHISAYQETNTTNFDNYKSQKEKPESITSGISNFTPIYITVAIFLVVFLLMFLQ